MRDASVFHFSGHGMSDPADADRCALLVAAPPDEGDPLAAWSASVEDWQELDANTRVGDVDGVGRLWETAFAGGGALERRLEQPDGTTWYARYADHALVRFGRLWTAADILAAGPFDAELAFLSACECGVAGQVAEVDEFGGLPSALQLAGVRTLVCSLWVVSPEFAAVNVDLFYELLSAPHAPADVFAVVRDVQRRLREMERTEVISRLDGLADAVRARSPRAAMALEASRRRIEREGLARPFGDPWQWASFYAVGAGAIPGAIAAAIPAAIPAHPNR
jgi:CHAT domain-containing protein